MKKYISVFGLWAAMTFWPCAAICVLLTAVELTAAFIKLPSGGVYYGVWGFSYFAESIGMGKIYGAALLIMCLAIYFSCRGANRLTLSRLTVSARQAAALHAACVLSWLLALWATQFSAILVIIWRYYASLGVRMTAPVVLNVVYDGSFSHWFMPLKDWEVCLIMALVQLGLALSLAMDSLKYRTRGGFPLDSVIMGAVTAMCIGARVDSESWFGIAMCAVMIGVQVFRFWAFEDTEVL